MIPVPSTITIGVGLVRTLLIILLVGVVGLSLWLLIPHRDSRPAIETARKDERTAATAAATVGHQVEAANRDTTTSLDITLKGIQDDLAAPQRTPLAPADGAALPPAPVDRLRDRLNESIARANGAAGATPDPD